MTALDFTMYCTGVGIVLVSIGLTVRLVTGIVRQRSRHLPGVAPVWEPMPDTSGEGLMKRMTEFQSARYSSPIVKRTLSDDAGPKPRSSAPVPFRRPVQRPRQEQTEKVIQFPQKMQTKKEE